MMQQICTGQLHPLYLEQKAVPLASLLVMASLVINFILLLLIAKKKGSISEVVPIHCPNVIPIGNILLSWTTTFFMTLEGVAYIYINRHKIKFLAYLEQFHPYNIIFFSLSPDELEDSYLAVYYYICIGPCLLLTATCLVCFAKNRQLRKMALDLMSKQSGH